MNSQTLELLALIGQVYTQVSRMYNLVIIPYVILVVVYVLTTRLIYFLFFIYIYKMYFWQYFNTEA